MTDWEMKVHNFMCLNKSVKKGEIVFTGSSLCELILEKKIEAKPFPMNFGEPAFISTYKTAYMVFMESVRK